MESVSVACAIMHTSSAITHEYTVWADSLTREKNIEIPVASNLADSYSSHS